MIITNICSCYSIRLICCISYFKPLVDRFYASPSSRDAYSDRQLILNLELSS